MTNEEQAFQEPIKSGNARILLRLKEVVCEVENNAPDFITVENDEVELNISLSGNQSLQVYEFEKPYALVYKGQNKDDELFRFKVKEECIWFDIRIDQIKDIWVTDLQFSISSKNSRYIAYYIKELDHEIEWLQPDMKSGEIKVMSISQKKFKPPKISGRENYSALEVIRCADMIGRAVRKIDLRTGGAYVKFNTDKGRLEPLIVGMGEKLGYKIESLTKEEVVEMESNGHSASHSIYLKSD